MPRSKQQNEQIREERRKEILAAAVGLFALNGFAETSVSAIAKAAGVSHGTVFLYFPSKEELFRAALVEPLSQVDEWLSAIGREDLTPLQRIYQMVRTQVGMISRQESYLRLVQYVLGARDRFPEHAQIFFDVGKRYTGALVPVIEEGQRRGELAPGNPQGIAWAWFSMMQGIGLNVIDVPESCVWELMIQTGMRLFGPLRDWKEAP